ncbi:hypothetical protein A4E84_29755 [Streptomyces qaidamensis]|uniref:Tail assembly chaperone n=1 Tax=Streptomyces qaidamensis TaxID=1783515 RepID=A0A143C7B3_9ACTN|nr:hypothetical protein [Streptomyces qaidamensis]AMW13313.1 hypothetical protein A4E84_29755 [Streptomyces qaidamensis]
MAAARTPRASTARTKAVQYEDNVQEPEIIEISTGQRQAEEIERIPVFSIDGTVYTIPKIIPRWMTMRVLKEARAHGQEVASQMGIELILGEEALEALNACNEQGEVSDEQYDAILDKIQKRAFGQAAQQGKASKR